MPKPLKSLAKAKATNDLFGAAEPKGRSPAQGRLARFQRRGRLYRARHRGARRPRAGAAPARHVYRRHRREGAASSVRRSHRQLDGRGAGGPCHLHRGGTGRRRIFDRHRQRPRHSGRSASEISEKIRARSHHVHAAFRRQIRLQGLRDLGRPARRRRLRGERAVVAARGRGRARPEALPHGVRARPSQGQARRPRQDQQPPRHQDPLQAGQRDFRRQGRLQAAAAVQDGALQSLPVRRRRDPLALRSGAAEGHRGCAGRGQLSLPRRTEGLSRRRDPRRHPGAPRYLLRQIRARRRARRLRMGGRLDRGRRRLPVLLLQHRADAGRRHA